MPRPILHPALLAAVLVACGGPAEPADAGASTANSPSGAPAAGNSSAAAALAARGAAARARVDALIAEPGPATLLAVLATPHADARALRGPHRLHYKARFDLVPAAKPGRPAVGEPIEQERHVVDELTLVWAAAAGEPTRLHITQSVGDGEEQELVIVDEQAYTRLAHRAWQVRPLDSELHTIWLDEAQHSVHDLVELAAPALAGAVEAGDDAVTVTLSRAEAVDPSRNVAGTGREWRRRTEITAVSGTVTLERATGLWRSGDVAVAYDLLFFN